MSMPAQKKRLVVALMGAIIFVVGSILWLLRWNDDELLVYETSIKEAFSDGQVSYYVILDTTQPIGRMGISDFHATKLGLTVGSRFSYTSRNVFRFHIPPKLDLPHPYQLVSQAQLASIYSPMNNGLSPSKELSDLLQKSWGVITLSRVGLDHSRKHAVVYAQLTYCGLCGEGTYLYLSKETGAWHIVGRAGTWIS